MALRWGIASTGQITLDFLNCLKSIDASNHEVVAVGDHDLNRVKEFAQKFNILNMYQGFQELATHPDIEIVYIGALNPQHYDIAKLMLENGKHVLVEKPLCLNHKQAKILIELARTKKLFLLEGIWSRFFPIYAALREEIDSGSVGDVLHISVNMGSKIAERERIRKNDQGGGSIMGLGMYPLQLAQFIFKDYPENVTAVGELNEEGVDLSSHSMLQYSGGRTAVMTVHCKVELPNEAYIVGTKGYIKLHRPFWCPTTMTTANGKIVEFKLPEAKQPFVFINSAGLSYEAEECRRCIREGLIESPKMSHEESLTLAKLEDTIRAQIGVKFSVDE